MATQTIIGEPILLAGADCPDTINAVLSLLPLDFFEPCAAWHMEVQPRFALPSAPRAPGGAGTSSGCS